MKRFMVLEGIDKILVPDPFAEDPHRMVGQERKMSPERKGKHRREHYKPIKRVYPWHAYLVKNVMKGCLKQHGKAFVAESLEQAMKKLQDKPSRSTKSKGGE